MSANEEQVGGCTCPGSGNGSLNWPCPEHPPFSYYHVNIAAPATAGRSAYTAECQDIIDALGMTFAEGCAFKAIWRNAAARTLGKIKPGSQGGIYDAEKVAYYGQRMVLAESKSAPPPRNAEPAPVPDKLPLLPIVVGGVYRARDGYEVTIESRDESRFYPFDGSNSRTYDNDGFEYNGDQSPHDLVERIS